ncbi:unnamed protein product [Urochloa humidicola]
MRVRPAKGGSRPAADAVGNATMSSTVLGGGSHGALPSAATAPTAQGEVRRSLRRAVPATEVSGVPVRLLGPQRLRIREQAFVATDAPMAASRWPPSSEPRWCRAPAPPFRRLSRFPTTCCPFSHPSSSRSILPSRAGPRAT